MQNAHNSMDLKSANRTNLLRTLALGAPAPTVSLPHYVYGVVSAADSTEIFWRSTAPFKDI